MNSVRKAKKQRREKLKNAAQTGNQRRRPKRRTRPKVEERISLKVAEPRIRGEVKTGSVMREAKAYDAVSGSYLKAVFNTEQLKPCRIPSIFPSPSGVFCQTVYYDILVPSSAPGVRSHVVVMPWNLIQGSQSVATSLPAFVSWGLNVGNGGEFTETKAHPMFGFLGTDQSTTARYSAYRTVGCSVQLTCLSPAIQVTGTVTAASMPSVQRPASAYVSGWVPSATALLNHPFGFQRTVTSLYDKKFKVVYLPLDPLDQIFHSEAEPADEIRFRSPLVMVFDSLTNALNFRITVSTMVEYIPTLLYKSWTQNGYGEDKPRTFEVARSLVINAGKHAATEAMGEVVSKIPDQTTGDKVFSFLGKAASYLPTIASVGLDLVGGNFLGAAQRIVRDISVPRPLKVNEARALKWDEVD